MVFRVHTIDPIHTIDTTMEFEGWIRVNISEIVRFSTTHPEPNHLLYVTIKDRNARGELVTTRNSNEVLLSIWDQNRRPFVTAYFKNKPIPDDDSNSTAQHRYGDNSQHSRQRRSIVDQSSSRQTNPLIDRDAPATIRHCRRYGLYISFEELQLTDVILAPAGYAAFYCSGHCKFPVRHDVRITNHAIVQTLAHIQKPHLVPLPCCAPKRYAPITVIYMLKDTITYLKKFPQMMVKECECQ